jgi:hypothetical protein
MIRRPLAVLVLLLLAIFSGCKGGGQAAGEGGRAPEAKEDVAEGAEEEPEAREAEPGPGETEEHPVYLTIVAPYSASAEDDGGDPPLCVVHEVRMEWRMVRVFHGHMPVDEAYFEALPRLFPNSDDPAPSTPELAGRVFVTRYVCPKCVEARDRFLAER